jgi:hypothetical protein
VAKKAVPELRMVVVTGPGIDPTSFPRATASSCTAQAVAPADLDDEE